jgi:hypothetical protein
MRRAVSRGRHCVTSHSTGPSMPALVRRTLSVYRRDLRYYVSAALVVTLLLWAAMASLSALLWALELLAGEAHGSAMGLTTPLRAARVVASTLCFYSAVVVLPLTMVVLVDRRERREASSLPEVLWYVVWNRQVALWAVRHLAIAVLLCAASVFGLVAIAMILGLLKSHHGSAPLGAALLRSALLTSAGGLSALAWVVPLLWLGGGFYGSTFVVLGRRDGRSGVSHALRGMRQRPLAWLAQFVLVLGLPVALSTLVGGRLSLWSSSGILGHAAASVLSCAWTAIVVPYAAIGLWAMYRHADPGEAAAPASPISEGAEQPGGTPGSRHRGRLFKAQ